MLDEAAWRRWVGVWAHSINEIGRRHGLEDHLRSTAELARRFASVFGAGELGWAVGVLHDVGKADCGWQQRLLSVEATGGRVGGEHWSLGSRMLLERAGPAAMTVLGHHRGLTTLEDLKSLAASAMEPEELRAEAALQELMPEVLQLVHGPSLIPEAWVTNEHTFELGLRLLFSALVDADHLDTAAHFEGRDAPQLRSAVDMAALAGGFESARAAMLADRAPSPIDDVRAQLYEAATEAAASGPGLFRLPAPTGSGKTMTAASFALHHAARNGQSRVIVAVPFTTITEQNAQVYRQLLGAENVLEHHSNADFDGRRAKLAAENWDAPFVVTTTVQLFDSLFGRKPGRSRKLHRLANAVIVLDEVQALPISLLIPILDALRGLTRNFGTTVLLASATQPAFEHLDVWRRAEITSVVPDAASTYERLRRVVYEWWCDPQPTMADIAERAAKERQVLIVVNTTADSRAMFAMVSASSEAPVFHLSARMCAAHRRVVLDEVRDRLAAEEPVIVVSTQLIEAGVDIDLPLVFRAYAPAESLQQAAGRANREGRRVEPGRVVVFRARDGHSPDSYTTASETTAVHFGEGKADPDDLAALERYYRHLYNAVGADRNERGTTIQARRKELDFQSVTDGPVVDAGRSGPRNTALAFRMIDDDSIPVVVTRWADGPDVSTVVEQIRWEPTRDALRAVQPYVVALPRYLLKKPDVAALAPPILVDGELREWCGNYHPRLGIEDDVVVDTVL